MTDKPAVLILHKHLGAITPFLEGAYDVYGLWDAPPVEAANKVRAVIMAGEFELDRRLVESLPALGLIACFTSGYDGVDVGWAHGRGLQVTHAPGVNHEDVADHALGLILASRREIVSGDRAVREGRWSPTEKTITRSLKGQKLGIVGLGLIGAALARRAEACGLDVLWWGPNPKLDAAWPKADSLLQLAQESDILVVCARADEANRGLISREVVEAIGPAGLLVNVSRGQLVDEEALIEALRAGRLGSAALDVFVQEPTPADRWTGVPNLVLTPHTAGATTAAVQQMLQLLLENLRRFFAGQELATPVRG